MLKSVRKITIILCVITTMSCSVKPDDISESTPIDEIFALAKQAQDRGNFQEAGDFYMEIDNLYPYSDKSRAALVNAMKSYHKGSDLLSARLSAQRYLVIYPKGNDAAFSKYIIGLSYFDSIIDVQRDQGAAWHAVREFSDLISEYPDSEYTKLSREHLSTAYSQLAGQEMAVGRYYMKRQDYLAAVNRFLIVEKEYSDTPFAVEALYRLIEAYTALGLEDLARSRNAQLQKRYPSSGWAEKSNKLVYILDK